MPIRLNAATNGDEPGTALFHGRIATSRNVDPTKNTAMRMITEFAALATAFSGSSDSAAAIVAISAPTIDKMVATTPTVRAETPCGKNPPWEVRLEKSMCLCGHRPKTNNPPSPMKAMIAATLIPANQYSNSPNDATENRLVAVIATSRINEVTHNGIPGNQNPMIFAPATASKPTTVTQKYQYSHPTEKPAQLP